MGHVILIVVKKAELFVWLQYIGSMEVPRPSSRVEIVAAMRTVRVCYVISFLLSLNVDEIAITSVLLHSPL